MEDRHSLQYLSHSDLESLHITPVDVIAHIEHLIREHLLRLTGPDGSPVTSVGDGWRESSRRDRPRGVGRAGGARYWMSSSARTRMDCGIVNPSALAVLRLMISSNFMACSTGRSAGLAPLRILSTNVAARLCKSEKFVA
jgi:hypothetical protein